MGISIEKVHQTTGCKRVGHGKNAELALFKNGNRICRHTSSGNPSPVKEIMLF